MSLTNQSKTGDPAGKRLFTAAAVILLLLATAASGPHAEGEKLPSGEEICDRFAEVSGGMKALAAKENRVSKGVFELPAQGMTLDMTVYAARPDFFRSVVEHAAIGRMERGVVDGVAWETSMMSGPSVKEGAERDIMLRDATFERIIDWRQVYTSAECTGEELVNDKKCYRVEMGVEAGEPHVFFYEKDSGLLLKISAVTESQMGKMTLDSFFSDYRKVGDLLVSHAIDVHVMGQVRSIRMTSIEYDVELPGGIFDPPEDVKALLEK